MKVVAVCALALGLALPCAAQGNVIKKITSEAFEKNASQLLRQGIRIDVLNKARIVQGKILPSGKPVAAPYLNDIERHLFKSVRPRGISLLEGARAEQVAEVLDRYHQTMKQFEGFRKEMDVFLYYQSKPLERHTLSSAEKGVWSRKIVEMHSQLERLKPFIFSKDPAYQAACEYVAYAAQVVDPLLCGAISRPMYASPGRVYKKSEFFLHAPRGKKSARWNNSLPKQLRVAILNDETDLLNNFLWMQQMGGVPAGWKVRCYTDTEKLLQDVLRAAEKPDLIITDLIVPGGGGFYLTGMLRDAGYNGTILALTAFTEKDRVGRRLFESGFDGMIFCPLNWEYDSQWGTAVLEKVRTYFYYRQLYGWKR